MSRQASLNMLADLFGSVGAAADSDGSLGEAFRSAARRLDGLSAAELRAVAAMSCALMVMELGPTSGGTTADWAADVRTVIAMAEADK